MSKCFTRLRFWSSRSSPKTTAPGEIQEKIRDYTDFGVRFVWVIDPQSRRGYVYTKRDSFESKDGVLRTEDPRLEVVVEDILSGSL